MNRRLLVASTVLFFLLLGVTLWTLRERKADKAPPFFSLGRPLPDTLLVAYGADTTLLVRGEETGWSLIRPVAYPADPAVLEALVKRLDDLPVDRIFPLTPERMESYGMNLARGAIVASYRDGTPADSLTIGGFTPNEGFYYVRSGSEERVALVDTRIIKTYLLKSTMDLRDARLMPFSETRCRSFRLLGPEEAVRVALERDAEGRWIVTHPHRGIASQSATRNFLESVAHMHIERFLREGGGPLEPYGLDRPLAGALAVLEGGDTLGVYLGEKIPGDPDNVVANARSQPHVLGVPALYVEVLSRGANEFFDPRQFAFGLDAVVTVELESGPFRKTLSLRPDSVAVSREVRDVLAGWVLLEATSFSPATPESLRTYGLDPPAGRLTWIGNDDTLAVVDIGVPGGNTRALCVPAGDRARPDEILLVPERNAGPLWNYLLGNAGVPLKGSAP